MFLLEVVVGAWQAIRDGKLLFARSILKYTTAYHILQVKSFHAILFKALLDVSFLV